MGTPKWTAEQKQAIDTRGCSLLVAAAAGAGKTAVLVERIIQRIIDLKNPVDIDRLLVVTFTNAAASEMRERIGDAISKELEKNPDSYRLQRQIALLGKADITTIHSFCLEVIRNNFHLIDLDPSFRIADTTECLLLKQEALEEIFDENYENEGGKEGFLELVECYGGGRDDRSLQDMVLRLYEFSQSTPWPEEWLYDAAEKFNAEEDFDFGKSPWANVLIDNIGIELSGIQSAMERALSMLDGVDELRAYYVHFQGEIEAIKHIVKLCEAGWSELCDGLSSIEFKKLPTCRNVADKDTQEAVKKIRKGVKDQIDRIKDEVTGADSKKIGDEMRRLYPYMKRLSSLVEEFGSRYRVKKKEKGVIDFNDIEHYCIHILTERDGNGNGVPSPTALMYREKFEEVLVDEYQDSNMVQELIISMVSRKDSKTPNLFLVGDVKQSIYRFRQAMPELFLEKYNTYKDVGRERKILLYKNFRSRKEVLDGINYIFKAIMSQNIGELEYGDDEKLNPGADYRNADMEDCISGGPVEVNIIETAKIENDDQNTEDENDDIPGEAEEDIGSIQLEARLVAGRINELLYGKEKKFVVYDKLIDGYRHVEYRDIVILMRSVASSAPIFVEELSKKDIPVYADTGTGYFATTEVQVIISLLQVIDNPMQDIPLLAVLRSPIGSFTPEELVEIRMADSGKSFYEALKSKTGACDDVGNKASEFLKCLERWRKKSQNMSMSEFIWYLYTDTGYYGFAGAMPGGIQRQANLRVLFERARQYEETSFKGLFNFINFINKLKSSSGDMGSAKILGENENVVRIMSIHKSKGLEFSVVIVSSLGKKFNLRDLEKDILFHHELGFGPDFVDGQKRLSYPTIIKQALKKRMKLESYSEEMRILYVALTRAKEKLIVTGTVGDMEKALARWAEGVNSLGNKVPEYQILKGSNFLDWICPALLKHRDCSKIREVACSHGISPEGIIDDTSKWDIKLWNREEVLLADMTDQEAAAGSDRVMDMDGSIYGEEVRRRLDFNYPYMMSSKLPAKLSVTELKRMFGTMLDDEYAQNIFVPPLIKKPSFMEGKTGLSAAEKGTAMHLVMQHINLDKVPEHEYITSIIERMIAQEFMTFEQGDAVDIEKITEFFRSPLGTRLIMSGNAKREVPFYMQIKGNEVYRDLPGENYDGEKIILQGIIDCYFEEDDGLVLIDYKTDYVPEGNTDKIKDKYRLQIEYYTKALESITGKKVKERYIYLFYNGEILAY